MQELFALRSVADTLKTSIKTLYRLRRRGELSFVKVGNRNRITADEINRYLIAHSDTVTSGQQRAADK